MYGKFKLNIFVHKGITDEQRRMPAFGSAVALLGRIYAAHLVPKKSNWWRDPESFNRPMDDDFTRTPSKYFDYIQEGFQKATRVEMHLLPCDERCITVEIEFFTARKSTGHKLVFTYHLDQGHIGAGFIGGERICSE